MGSQSGVLLLCNNPCATFATRLLTRFPGLNFPKAFAPEPLPIGPVRLCALLCYVVLVRSLAVARSCLVPLFFLHPKRLAAHLCISAPGFRSSKKGSMYV